MFSFRTDGDNWPKLIKLKKFYFLHQKEKKTKANVANNNYVIVNYRNKRYPGVVEDADNDEHQINVMENSGKN